MEATSPSAILPRHASIISSKHMLGCLTRMIKRDNAALKENRVGEDSRHVENSLLREVKGSRGTRKDRFVMLDACDSEFCWIFHVFHFLPIMHTTYYWVTIFTLPG